MHCMIWTEAGRLFVSDIVEITFSTIFLEALGRTERRGGVSSPIFSTIYKHCNGCGPLLQISIGSIKT